MFRRTECRVLVVLAVMLSVGGGCTLDRGDDGQNQGASIQRLDGTPHPDLSGVWQALNEANWDLEGHDARTAIALQPGVPHGSAVPKASVLLLGAMGGIPGSLGVVEGGTIPYRSEALQKRKDNFEKVLERDPEVKCFLPGVPRATYLPYPFQIIQGSAKINVVYGFSNAGRTIHLDEVAEPPVSSWMGHSAGRWEGDSLIVEVTHQNDQTWLDRAGNFHSAAMRVVERYTPVSRDHLLYEATIDDPETFTRPWKIKMPLYRRIEEHAQVFEYRCVEMVEELLYGHLRKTPLVTRSEHAYGPLGGLIAVDLTRRASAVVEP